MAGESEEITPTFPVRTGICNGPSTCPHSRAGMVLCDTLDSDVTSDVLPVYDAVHLGDAIVTPPLCKPWQREQLVVLRSEKCPEPFGLPVDLRVFFTSVRGFHYSWSSSSHPASPSSPQFLSHQPSNLSPLGRRRFQSSDSSNFRPPAAEPPLKGPSEDVRCAIA